jgi:conserved domain protein
MLIVYIILKNKTNTIMRECYNFINSFNNIRGGILVISPYVVEIEANKECFERAANITSNIVLRITENAYVNLELIKKNYLSMNCKIEDVVEIIKEYGDLK